MFGFLWFELLVKIDNYCRFLPVVITFYFFASPRPTTAAK